MIAKQKKLTPHPAMDRHWRRFLSWSNCLAGLFLCSFALAVIIPNCISACCYTNDSAAIGSLRTINASQAVFLERSPLKRYGSLEELGEDHYIDNILREGFKRGYVFQVAQRTVDGVHQYWVKACPEFPGETGDRFFFTNEKGVIYETERYFEPGFYKIGEIPEELHRVGQK